MAALLAAGAALEAKDSSLWTALMLAADKGQARAVSALLAGGAAPSAALPNGWAPLHFAAKAGSADAVAALLAGGADMSAKLDGKWTVRPLPRTPRPAWQHWAGASTKKLGLAPDGAARAEGHVCCAQAADLSTDEAVKAACGGGLARSGTRQSGSAAASLGGVKSGASRGRVA